jgi:tetratricopeptide (TPR) repeat protein
MPAPFVLILLLTTVLALPPGSQAGPSPSLRLPGLETGQEVGTEAPGSRRDPRVRRADFLLAAGQPREALRAVEVLLDEDPGDYEALWRAASFAVALGVMADDEAGGRPPEEWYEKAEGFAARALHLDAERVEARYWRVAALGRQALSAGPMEAAALADRIWEGSLEILELDPAHPGAHHALGRLYYEVMTLSGARRFLGRTFSRGRALDEASWPRAEEHLRRAVELAPDMVLYRLDLARFHLQRGDPALARAELRRVVEEADPGSPDRAFALEARRLLREVDG